MFQREKRMKHILILSIFSLFLVSCEKNPQNDELKLITTTSFIYDTVQRIAGDRVKVINLISDGQDPHSFEPTPRDIAEVETADIIFVNGFNLEEGLLDIIKSVNGNNIFSLSDNIVPISNEEHHESDPHTWMSPLNVIIWTEHITKALITLKPEDKDYFTNNKKIYIEELLELHNFIAEELNTILPENRIMVTDHDSFAYFAREYKFKIAGTIIPNISTSSDISSKSLIELIETIRMNKTRAIFIGDTSGKDMKELAQNIESELDYPIRIVTLKTGSLDGNGSEIDSYIKYMKYNVKQIIFGLSE
jgi:manganese/iron transport system substrate-binding protein